MTEQEKSEIRKAISDLIAARVQFDYYRECHEKKGTLDGDEKAEVNRYWADRMNFRATSLSQLLDD